MTLLELINVYQISHLIRVNLMFLFETNKVKKLCKVKRFFMQLPEQVTINWFNSCWIQKVIKTHGKKTEQRRS